MKKISIKTQEVLALIPIINSIGIFVFIYQCIILKPDKNFFIKTLLTVLPVVLVFGVGMAIIDLLFGSFSELYKILSIVSAYLFPATVFYLFIFAQIKFYGETL